MKTKYTIMKNRPEASEEEIQNFMDFDVLLEKREQTLKSIFVML